MNKALHVFIYLFLIGTGVALWYEYQLHDKRAELKDRNYMMEDFLVERIAGHIEDGSDYGEKKGEEPATIKKDRASATDPDVQSDERDILSSVPEYSKALEETKHRHLAWGEAERKALRQVYALNENGEPIMEGADRLKRGSQEEQLLEQLCSAVISQENQLKATREALPKLRELLEEVVAEYNALTPKLRASIRTNNDYRVQISDLKDEKQKLEAKQSELENRLKEKELDIVSLRDEVETAKKETEEVKDSLEKQTKLAEALKKQIQQLIAAQQTIGRGTITEGGAIQSLPFGEKGKIKRVNSEFMFAIVEFNPDAMKQLKGNDLSRPLPLIELGVKRTGYEGPAGEFVGRVRLRQEALGSNYVMCEILSNWTQSELKPGDIIFAE